MSRTVKKNTYLWLVFASLPIILLLREAHLFFWPSSHTRFLTMGLALAISLVTLCLTQRSNTYDIKKPTAISIGLFLFTSLISSLLSNFFYHSMLAWAEFSCYVLMAFTVFRALSRDERSIELSLAALAMSLIFILLMLLLKWCILVEPRDYEWVPNTPFVNNIRHLGYLICLLLPIGFYGLNKASHFRFILTIVFLSIAWALIFWMGGRGAFIAVLAASVLAWFILDKNKHWLYLTPAIGFVLSQPFWVNDAGLNLFRIFQLEGDAIEKMNILSANRLFIWLKAIELWWQNAPVLGLGPDSYRYLGYVEFSGTVQPHSIIPQVLISYGLVGLFSSVVLLIQYLLFLWRAPKSNQLIGLCVLAGLAHSLTDGVLYHAFSSFLFVCLLTLSLIQTSSKKEPLCE